MEHLHITSVRCKNPLLYNMSMNIINIIAITRMMMIVNCMRGYKHTSGPKKNEKKITRNVKRFPVRPQGKFGF